MSSVAAPSSIPTASDPAYADALAKLPGFDRVAKKTLGQEDFLKLLSTQLANQNPLEPSSDLNSISQMASFSSAQQMSELVTSLKSFIVTQDFASTQDMLGKYVTVTTEKTSATSTGAAITEKTSTSGVVTSVGYDENGVSVIKIGGQSFSPADVTGISPSAQAAAADAASETPQDFGTASGMLGKSVTVTQSQQITSATGAVTTVRVSTTGMATAAGTATDGTGTIKIGDKFYSVADVTAVAGYKNSTASGA